MQPSTAFPNISELSLDRDIGHVEGEGPHLQYREDSFRNVIRKHHTARDITGEFTKASSALRVGQIIKDDTFTLSASVQAVEIMEPKMDTGYLHPGEILYGYYDIERQLLPEEVLGIIDQLLCAEMAWHQGYPLAQTIFTSLHVDNLLSQERVPKQIPYFTRYNEGELDLTEHFLQKVLRAYCISVIKTCDMVIEMVTSQQYYEEEDLSTNTYDRDLLTDIPDEESLDLLDAACEWLEDSPPRVLDALISHLYSRKLLMESIVPNRPSGDSPVHRWQVLKRLLQHIRDLHVVGRPQKDAFDLNLQCKFATNAPPRPISDFTFEEACEKLFNLYDDLEAAVGVLEFSVKHSPGNLFTFLWAFAARNPQPSAFARGILMSLIVGEHMIAGPGRVGQLVIQEVNMLLGGGDVIDDSLLEVELPTDRRYKLAKMVECFVDHASLEFTSVLRCLCQNQGRIRRCLINVLSEAQTPDIYPTESSDENSLDSPESLDSESIYCAIRDYLYAFKIRVVEWIVQLGFTNDLYQAYELSGIYWYLSYVSQARTQLLVVKIHRRQEEIVANFATGLSLLYIFLARLGLVVKPQLPYCTPEWQFEVRMRPFSTLVVPTPPGYEQFREGSEGLGYEKNAELLHAADLALGQARKHILEQLKEKDINAVGKVMSEEAWNKDMKAVLNSCIRTRIAVDKLQKGVKTYGEKGILKKHIKMEIPAPSKRPHIWWVVPEITVT